MKRIVSVALLLIMLLAFTACDQTQTSQNPSQSATESSEQTLAATATHTIEITQAPTATVTPTLEITKKPIVTNNPNSDTATRDPNWQPATFPPEMTKADYDFDFGITYIIDDINVLRISYPVKEFEEWKNNDGDSSQLEQAIQAIQNMDFRFSEDYDTTRPYDPSNPIACAHKEVTQRVKETIKDYKVYLEDVVLSPNSIYYTGHSGKGLIRLVAGDKVARIDVERVIFGCPVTTPTVKPTATPTAAPTPTVKPIVDYSKYNIQTVSKLIYTSEYGWELGMGNSDNLKKAIDEIVALDFEFLNEFNFARDIEEKVQEKAIQSITPILEKYDVYVYYILIYPGPLWSGEDENGSFISGQSVNMNIALGAGNMIASVKSQYD